MEYSLLIFSAVPGAAAPQQGGSGGGGGGPSCCAFAWFLRGGGPKARGAQLLREGREAGRVPKARPKTQGPRETQEPEVFRLLFGSMLVWAASLPAIPNNSRIGTSSKNDQ